MNKSEFQSIQNGTVVYTNPELHCYIGLLLEKRIFMYL